MKDKLMKKSLCKWEADEVKKNWQELAGMLSQSKYYCAKCLRSSGAKGTLCKPQKLA